jgi:hypothetical protein
MQIDPHIVFVHFNCEIQKIKPNGMISGIVKQSLPSVFQIKCNSEVDGVDKVNLLTQKIKDLINGYSV